MAKYTMTLGKAITDGLIDWDSIMSNLPDGGDREWKASISNLLKKHYWFREIGFETTEIFAFYLGNALREIGPYYLKLKEASALDLGLDPLESYREQETSTVEGEDNATNSGNQNTVVSGEQTRTDALKSETTNTATSKTTASGTVTTKNDTDGYEKNYAIPMTGGSSGTGPGGFSDDFATGGRVTHNTDSGENKNTEQSQVDDSSGGTISNTGTQTLNNSGNTNLTINGTQNTKRNETITRTRFGTNTPKFELLVKYRESIVNLNMMLIKDMAIIECFLGVF